MGLSILPRGSKHPIWELIRYIEEYNQDSLSLSLYIYMYMYIYIWVIQRIRWWDELSSPEDPSTIYLRTLVPNTIKDMVIGTREIKHWVLGPSGLSKLFPYSRPPDVSTWRLRGPPCTATL